LKRFVMGAVEHLKTLCCLGLPPESAMIAVAPLLHEIIPHGWYRASLIDPDCTITAAYAEHPRSHAIFRERVWKFLDDPKALVFVVIPSFHAVGIGWTLHRQGGCYLESAYYRETEAELDACWILDSMIGYEGKSIAGMQLTRPRSARPFTTDDVQRLDRLRPWLGHAFRPTQSNSRAVNSKNLFVSTTILKGQMILTSDAKLLFQSPEMDFLRQVLDGIKYVSYDNRISRFRWATPREIPLQVQKLVNRLLDAANGTINHPPRMKVSTSYGVVALEAKWLVPAGVAADDAAKEPNGCLICVTIDLHEYGVAHAARVLRGNGATPAQTHVGIRLALGDTKPQIAKNVGIQVSSVEDSIKKLYRRINVHSAAELSSMLWLEESVGCDAMDAVAD
jgi:DNA-binding CsgD family transcriptional regulator